MESHIDIAVQALHDKRIQTIVATARLYKVPPTRSRFWTLLGKNPWTQIQTLKLAAATKDVLSDSNK
jgi:hypothetical protein